MPKAVALNSDHIYTYRLELHASKEFSLIFRRAVYLKETFTTIPNALLRGGDSASNKRSDGLTPEALGVLVYLLSHSPSWKVSQAQLRDVFGIGKTKLQKIVANLEVSGYVKRHVERSESGKYIGLDFIVSDSRNQPDSHIETPQGLGQAKPKVSAADALINLFDSKPDGITKAAWIRWWEYKIQRNNKRVPAKKTITRQTHDCQLLINAKFDMCAVVDFAISRHWHVLGEPEWEALSKFKDQSRYDELLGAVK